MGTNACMVPANPPPCTLHTLFSPNITSLNANAIDSYKTFFGEGEIEIFSAPGRSEIGGNHTDHQHGEVLAASINNDAIAVARKLDEPIVKVMSDGYRDMIIIQLDELVKKTEEEGTTNALIRGVLAKMKMDGHAIGGFQAYVTSEVLKYP